MSTSIPEPNIFAHLIRPHVQTVRAWWLIAAGWGLYIASLFAPVLNSSETEPFLQSPSTGLECLVYSLFFFPLFPEFIPCAAANIVLLSSPYIAANAQLGMSIKEYRWWLVGSLVAALLVPFTIDGLTLRDLREGYYLWVASSAFLTLGFFRLHNAVRQ